MCTERQLDIIFRILKRQKTITLVPFNEKLFADKNIPKKDAFDGLIKLQRLGFATLTVFLNGDKSLEITRQGQEVYHAIY